MYFHQLNAFSKIWQNFGQKTSYSGITVVGRSSCDHFFGFRIEFLFHFIPKNSTDPDKNSFACQEHCKQRDTD
jgi:hypothetical protein